MLGGCEENHHVSLGSQKKDYGTRPRADVRSALIISPAWTCSRKKASLSSALVGKPSSLASSTACLMRWRWAFALASARSFSARACRRSLRRSCLLNSALWRRW